VKRRSAGNDSRQLLINWSDRSTGKSSAVLRRKRLESSASAESVVPSAIGLKRRSAGDDRRQLLTNWSDRSAVQSSAVLPSTRSESSASTQSVGPPAQEVLLLVQRCPWDFRNTFPEPSPKAIEAGEIAEEDNHPDNIRSIHEEHAREALTVLHDLDAVLNARRLGVDPRNRKKPMLPAAKERLQKFFDTEPQRLERWFQTLMDTYESSFGIEAADAFRKAIRAWHAGIEVIAEARPATRREAGLDPNERYER
jgi:hypothetical protein